MIGVERDHHRPCSPEERAIDSFMNLLVDLLVSRESHDRIDAERLRIDMPLGIDIDGDDPDRRTEQGHHLAKVQSGTTVMRAGLNQHCGTNRLEKLQHDPQVARILQHRNAAPVQAPGHFAFVMQTIELIADAQRISIAQDLIDRERDFRGGGPDELTSRAIFSRVV